MRFMSQEKKEYRVMTREEVRGFDAWAINELGMPGVVLMENAGRACAELVKERISKTSRARVCIICGAGNNGGDGYVIARHLLNDHVDVSVALCGPREKVRGDAAVNLAILEKQGQEIQLIDVNDSSSETQVQALLAHASLVVDAVFGTGLRGQLSEGWIHFIETINAQGIPIIAVDIPSGLDCDSGQPLGASIKAIDTVTFVAAKNGFTFPAAQAYTGRVHVASIGIDP
jgi:hydroxyethylthiazole kinase-like uncharacterized protein yjeF